MNDEEEEEEVEEEEDEPRARSLAFTCEEEFTIQRRQGGMNKPHYARRDNTPRGRRLLASRREVIHAVDRGSLQPCFHPISSLRRWINLAFHPFDVSCFLADVSEGNNPPLWGGEK